MSLPVDEAYILDAQDPNEPVWESDSNIAGMQGVDDPNDQWQESTPMIRNASGMIEFLNDIKEDVVNFLEDDKPPLQRKPKLEAIRTRELGSDKWRAGVRQVDATGPDCIVTESQYRRKVTLVNYGPQVAYLSAITSQAGAPNTIQLPVSGAGFWAPITICTRDNIYAICPAAGTAAIEILEEFDQEL